MSKATVLELKHWSWSKISKFDLCAVQFRNHYIEKIPEVSDFGLFRGRSTHHATGENLKYKLTEGELMPVKDLQEIAMEHLAHEIAETEWVLGPDYEEHGPDAAQNFLEQEVCALAACHHAEVAEHIEPEYVEEKITLPELSPAGLDFIGYMDCLERDGWVHDVKTTQKAPPKNKAHESQQLTWYGLMQRVLQPEIESPGQILDYLVRTPKAKKTYSLGLPTSRTDEDYAAALSRLSLIERAVEKEVFLPAPEDSWICSEKFCAYARDGSCEFFRRSKRPES